MPSLKYLCCAALVAVAAAVPGGGGHSSSSSKRTTSTSSYKSSSTTSTKSSTSTRSTSTTSASSTVKTVTVTQSATCTSSTSAYQSFYVNYNFENVGNGQINPTALEQVGEDDLLNFVNVAIIDNTVSQLGVTVGLVPPTPPNFAAFSAGISLTAGLTVGPAQISAAYTESSIDHFTAVQWFYGCVLASQNSELSVAVDCDITATGFNKAGVQVATQDFIFTSNGSLSQNFSFAYFNSNFVNLYYINLTVSNNLTTAALFDNFIAQLYELPASVFYPSV